ncbi:hypothetical protein AVEN_186550-1 [Araneus ventricosus]|uniref:Uncharacterized protein n=1 Tax=Araneus ventricosus TaxID=182803 RepID=A0A4Y2ULP0_ARAVE|nr:hypothetical protein AVEN_186550-1 [Araneus ventricosus]
MVQGRGGLVIRSRLWVQNPILLKLGLLHVKSYGGQTFSVGVVQKYSHWLGLPKKGVRPVEDQRGESRSTLKKNSGQNYQNMVKFTVFSGSYGTP